MIILSDNSSLSALAEVGYLDVLPQIFGQISIPEAVLRECRHSGSPEVLRQWIACHPAWLQIVSDPALLHPSTLLLGPGEAAAISVAWEHRGNSRLILDEKRGRRVAESLGLPKIGVLGLLAEAARLQLLNFEDAVERLRTAGFWMSEILIQEIQKTLTKFE